MLLYVQTVKIFGPSSMGAMMALKPVFAGLLQYSFLMNLLNLLY
jgi:hypothetical protein